MIDSKALNIDQLVLHTGSAKVYKFKGYCKCRIGKRNRPSVMLEYEDGATHHKTMWVYSWNDFINNYNLV